MKKHRGFTLMEVLVVLAIFAVLAGIAIPNVLGYIGKADRSAALEEEHNLIVAVGVAMKQGGGAIVSDYTSSGKVYANAGAADDDPAKYLYNDTEFEWIITTDGVLTPGDDNPLKPT
ncbi:type IV pilin protein [Dehalogenimonas etheniformans]|uniref:Type II secretion system protein n=1 Tax=Dehalogenimonas etheniformans TaxID=1536648 RepID=A0A2P5P8J9_9CHLR|nr:type II secretion system protein [Dehalogenimonas etheniformans]PPD58617.1 type II secretion system protein [Dehalogenimonas etheniformans]QNT76616.1 type II secretion system protein [Dehalogenimonas etheniformans]